jgi:iron complex outermembrane receptor protein
MSLPPISRVSAFCLAQVVAIAGIGATALADPAEPPAATSQPGEVIVLEGRHRDDVIGHGFRTVVDVDAHRGETTTLADILATSVGVNVRSLGGLGGFASVSIRGASPAHTAVFVDGIPLSRLAFATQDLGTLDLNSFSKLEVYRGAVPADLGGAAIGGAINLRTELGPDRDGHVARISVGAGSFGARHLQGRISDAALAGALRYHLGLGYRGATGDYSYFNDNGTLLVPDDDTVVDRVNNGFDLGSGVARARYQSARGILEGGSRTLWKEQGVPGVGSVQADTASLHTFTQLIDARFDARPTAGGLQTGATIFGLIERQRYRDLAGQVGLGNQDNRYQTLSVGSDATARAGVGRAHMVALGVGGRIESHAIDHLLGAQTAGPRGVRWSANALVSDELWLPWAVSILPALRIDYQRTDPGDDWDPITAETDDLGVRSDVFLSPRVTTRVPLGGSGGVVVKASVGRYFRAPTITELFGDRGIVVGNPALRPETGISADLGAVYAPAAPWGVADRRYLHIAVFASRPRSTIVLMPSAGRAAIARNLGNATIAGVETAAIVRLWQRLTVAGNYTFIDSRQESPMLSYDGKRLPLRPLHELYGRADLATPIRDHEIGVWSDLTFTSGNFLDAANVSSVPRRVLLGVGLKARIGTHFMLGLDVKNVTDRRVEDVRLDPAPRPDLASVPRAVSDFLGYPLPGRAFYLTADTSF